jgi:hypothetical protein
MAVVTVDQAKLVMNAFAAVFQNNLLATDLVSWHQYDTEMNDRNGLTVVEQVGPRYNVTQTTAAVNDLTSGVQDSVFGSEQFKVNQIFGSSMGWDDFVKVRDIGEARESTAIKNAATNLAEKIDAYIMTVAGNASNNWTGTPGNPVTTFNDFISGYTRLKEEGVDDSDLRGVLTYSDKQALASQITQLPALDDMATGVFRKGFSEEIGGIPTLFTQQIATLTTGTRTTPAAVAGAAQNVNYSAVAISGAPGQYMTQTLNLSGLGASTTIKDGEVFTIAGVNAYDNRLGASLGRLQQFRVIGDTAVAGGGTATVRIFPAIIVPGTGTAGDVGVNNAFGTVTAVPANTAVVTFIGAASTALKPRFIIQKQAIIVNTADLIMPATGIGSRKQLTKVPLSVRMWQNSDFATGKHSVRFDVALTANVRDRRRVVRVNGA